MFRVVIYSIITLILYILIRRVLQTEGFQETAVIQKLRETIDNILSRKSVDVDDDSSEDDEINVNNSP